MLNDVAGVLGTRACLVDEAVAQVVLPVRPRKFIFVRLMFQV